MRLPSLFQFRILKEAIKALFTGPYTSRFPKEPHVPFERFRGKPEFSKEDCVGCGACVQVCPSGALSMEDKGDKRILRIRWDICIFCGQCQANCLTEKGITLSHEFDLATTEKREELRQDIDKELVLCQDCKEIIAPYEQILWVAKRLGPLLFSNPSLMLFYLKTQQLSIDQPVTGSKEKEFLRADRIRILCPRCRREAVIKS
ncbi:MAG: 4Fe-4S binding protein [Candidatus Omnitrophota bacterium]|jgi:hydrogenase-4 component H